MGAPTLNAGLINARAKSEVPKSKAAAASNKPRSAKKNRTVAKISEQTVRRSRRAGSRGQKSEGRKRTECQTPNAEIDAHCQRFTSGRPCACDPQSPPISQQVEQHLVRRPRQHGVNFAPNLKKGVQRMEIKRVGSQPSGILLRWATAGQEGPASEKKWQVTRDECRANDLVTQWKLSEVDHTLRAKDHPIGLPAQFALIRCSRHPNRHLFGTQTSRLSRVPAPPGTPIPSVRR